MGEQGLLTKSTTLVSIRRHPTIIDREDEMAGGNVKRKLIAAKRVVTDPRLRTLSGKKKMLVEDGNVYGERISEDAFDKFLDKAYADEAIRKNLLAILHESVLSVKALAEKTGMRPNSIFRHLLVLQQRGQVEVARVEEHSPLYRSTVAEE